MRTFLMWLAVICVAAILIIAAFALPEGDTYRTLFFFTGTGIAACVGVILWGKP